MIYLHKLEYFQGEDSLNASTLPGAQPIPKKKQKGNKSASDVLDNKEGDLSKKDIKPTVFHSDQRIVVCLQNPYQKVSVVVDIKHNLNLYLIK